MSPPRVLYTYFRSSASYRVRIALNLKRLAYEPRPVHLAGQQHEATYRALNPQALVPTFVADTHVFTQSLAIIEYLEETHPHPALLPADAASRARVRAFACAIACDIHPLNNLRVLAYLRDELRADESQRMAFYRHWVKLGLDACEALLRRQARGSRHSHAFCFGETPTLADVCLVPQLFNARRFGCPLEDYPALQAVDERCATLDAFTAAHPSSQLDAE